MASFETFKTTPQNPMDFPELISNFAKRHSVAGLTAEIGEPPPDGAAAFADL